MLSYTCMHTYIHTCVYVFNGANQSLAGHVTGHADSKIISDFLKFLIYADVTQIFLPV